MFRFVAVGFALFCGFGISIAAEPAPDRYDLGQRLRKFDRAWELQRDPVARRRAVVVLKRAVPLLFAGRSAEVASTLDETRFLLRSGEPPSPAMRWAESLVIRPATRLLDPAGDPLTVMLTACYDAKVELPTGAMLRLTMQTDDGAPLPAAAEIAVGKLPILVALPMDKLPVGDRWLQAEVVVAGKVLSTNRQMISVVSQMKQRLDGLQTAALVVNTQRNTETATLRSLTNVLAFLAAKESLETDYPAARLFQEAEELSRAIAAKGRYYDSTRPGEYWLTVATDKDPAPVRLFVPEAVKTGKPVPLVVALHGAGGSENLFFDGYGDGATVRLAKERGWMVVATQAVGLFGGAPPVPAIIDELAKRYPVDLKRVYAIGHSMGATHALGLAQQSPGRFAALALLGGSGSVSKAEALQGLPIYVGCGAEDFALATAKASAQTLRTAGARVTYKELPDVEHIAVVQESLKDVFDFFAKAH